MDNVESEKFIALYNQLDAYMRNQLKMDRYVDHSTLLREMSTKNKLFSDYIQDLRTFADMRNMLTHNPYKRDADPLFKLHPYITKRYAEIVNLLLNPPKALSVAVPGAVIFTATLDTPLQTLMKTMTEKNYTHVPIMEGDEMVGIFSENTLLSYLVTNQEGLILKDATLADFADFIKPENHINEYFEFVPRNILLSRVEEIFRKGVTDKKRIAVVYVTENGKSTEKILGMLTPWDIQINQ